MGTEYTFEEFAKHYDDNYESIHASNPSGIEGTLIPMYEYLKTQYADVEEARSKSQQFMLIMMYVSQNIEAFDTEDFAVNGSPKVGALVSAHLLRAVHHFLANKRLSELREPTTDEVLSLAATFRGAE